MRLKGNILLILLIMLMFASVVLLQLNENNYWAHLVDRQVIDLSSVRKTLNAGFKKLSTTSISPGCYNDLLSCQINVSGVLVNYGLYHYQEDEQAVSYLQYTLKARIRMTSMVLTVVVEQKSGKVVSWRYYN